MKFYLAPMEGLTGQVYRQVYHILYGDMDQYFTPFITPNPKKIMRTRERKDVDISNNQGMHTVPQILTNQSEAFLRTCEYLKELGYEEVNLNLGCPSATVVTKGKGAGFLAHLKELDAFFADIFSKTDLKISVKSRLGMEFPEEMEDILAIFNAYPIHELIVHPRVQKQFYQETPDLKMFDWVLSHSAHPVCYNGDIFTAEDYEKLLTQFPGLDAVMLGRGTLANPSLVREITGGKRSDKEELYDFHNRLYAAYYKDLSSPKDVLFKMKEFWFYYQWSFDCEDRDYRNIKKAKTAAEYERAVSRFFENAKRKQCGGFVPPLR